MNYLLLHPGDLHETMADRAAAEGVELRAIDSPGALRADSRPTVFLLTPLGQRRFDETHLKRFVDGGGVVVAVGTGDEDVPDTVPERVISAYVPAARPKQLIVALKGAFREAAARIEALRMRHEVAHRGEELGELTQIGIALNTERDYDALLEQILSQARRITNADAGSLYLAERPRSDDQAAPGRLAFMQAQNASRPGISFDTFSVPIDHTSVAGHVAITARPLVIDDVYEISDDAPYAFNPSIDEKHGYRTKSLLTVPMINHKDEVIGILQLVNRKQRFSRTLQSADDFDAFVIPFSDRTKDLVSALAGQAAVSIDNRQLLKGIEDLFENFVEAAVLAIEQRDLPTRGHSRRVAEMTVALAGAVDRVDKGPYRETTFNRDQIKELRYAALLHDFGKVGVRERVLGKAKKLYESDLDSLRQRYGFALRTAERDFYRRQTEYLVERGRAGFQEFRARLDADHEQALARLHRFWTLVDQSNEPSVLPEGNFEELLRYASVFYQDEEGSNRPLLTEDEVRFLTIRQGSLDDDERRQIQDHVDHTYQFLSKITWTDELRRVPDIAWGHHEKLDGSGYPRKIGGSAILPQTRMMTIADIFDALSAQDRPYKTRLAPEQALDILAHEVRQGMLDAELFRIFADAGIYRVIG